MSSTIPFIHESAVYDEVSPKQAVAALREALLSGFSPELDLARVTETLSNGQILLMPSEAAEFAGIKVLTVAPGNPAQGLKRIQGMYILFDAHTLAPTCMIDGPALTNLRTPAVSLAATQDVLTRSTEPLDLVLYGAGQQGTAHLRTLRDVLGGQREISSVTAVTRSPDRISGSGIEATVRYGSEAARQATAAANLIVCATTSRTPLFDSGLIRNDAVVIAVGSHEPDARELESGLLRRANVVVEDIATALRECGDIVMAIKEGAISASDLVPMARAVEDPSILSPDRPTVFKSSGMSWEDLVIASVLAQSVVARSK